MNAANSLIGEQPCFPPGALEANSGGPSSRRRSEPISATLLGERTGRIQCPRVVRLGLEFGNRDPVACVERLLRSARLASPEELRAQQAIPSNLLVAAPLKDATGRLDVATAPPHQVLAQALLLGLCTSSLYDPARPVLWTRTSLTRDLELFDPAGFYA